MSKLIKNFMPKVYSLNGLLYNLDMKIVMTLVLILNLVILSGCSGTSYSLKVTATAYTSSKGETDSTPSITAWGDKLKPGMKSIAVSRDLIKMGLRHGTKVSIEGLDGEYIVLDKMNKRWKKKIDIYMGKDRKAAIQWGKKKVVIHWESEK